MSFSFLSSASNSPAPNTPSTRRRTNIQLCLAAAAGQQALSSSVSAPCATRSSDKRASSSALDRLSRRLGQHTTQKKLIKQAHCEETQQVGYSVSASIAVLRSSRTLGGRCREQCGGATCVGCRRNVLSSGAGARSKTPSRPELMWYMPPRRRRTR